MRHRSADSRRSRGSQVIQDVANRRFEEVRERVMEVLRAHFRPEFLNRVDEVIVFRQLTREQLVRSWTSS